MRLTHLADYAVVMMPAAARREPCARLSATDLSEETGVPLPTAQKLMQKLAAHGLLVGQRGAGGGYALARPANEISLADIVEAVEGPIVLTMCADGVNHECALDAHCKVKPHMSIVGDAIRTSLSAVSLAQLSSPAKAGAQTRRNAAPSAPGWTPAFAGERP
ncbi:Rrf2 family transcriptional regulator [Sphingomonas sp.]|uniref:RrF2 family transcriptional regulator n=1 Tax=Sphingomonas sp. TaxID=28214 RepID=UPI0025F970CE|nr:Rrf2 family transcriptional regulator [Sphingomonas sp.]